MQTVSIIGIGRAGGALALALDRAGVTVGQLIYRSEPPTLDGIDPQRLAAFSSLATLRSDIVLIATADPDILPTAEYLSRLSELPKIALHLSGSLSSDEITILRERGVAVGSMHPLVSISDAELGSGRFAGAYFCVEGDPEAVDAATSIVKLLGGTHFSIDTHFKPLYHASAVMASGHVTALFDAAIEMLSKCGVEPAAAHQVLLPLLRSTVANLSERTTRDALTGPFARGDRAAFERHLQAIDESVEGSIGSIYLELAERSVKLAGNDDSAQLLRAISMAKRKTGC